jgi:hypothetical protein
VQAAGFPLLDDFTTMYFAKRAEFEIKRTVIRAVKTARLIQQSGNSAGSFLIGPKDLVSSEKKRLYFPASYNAGRGRVPPHKLPPVITIRRLF